MTLQVILKALVCGIFFILTSSIPNSMILGNEPICSAHPSLESSANKVVFIMEPSCSGKSTIAQRLLQELGDCWVCVEYDDLESLVGRHVPVVKVFELLINRVNDHLAMQKNVIVDTNTFCKEQSSALTTANSKEIYVYAPLEVLLQRDALRTKNLSRSDDCAATARLFVVENFKMFYPQEVPLQGLFVINTIEQSLSQAVNAIKKFIE